jgi:siroheme synthase (precorrin-2 oxidase/ferrochelatase)
MGVNQSNTNGFQPVWVEQERLNLLIVGGGEETVRQLRALNRPLTLRSVTVVAPQMEKRIRQLAITYPNFTLLEKDFEDHDLDEKHMVIAASADAGMDEKVRAAASLRKIWVYSASSPGQSDFFISPQPGRESSLSWRRNGKE